MNEGWASYWHYKILQKLELPSSFYLEFIKRHNEVVRPVLGGINPYFLGFEIFKDLAEKYGQEKIFEVRSLERDQSFIRKFLTQELCVNLHLFEYVKKGNDYVVEEVADEEGWKEIRNTLSNSAGMGMVPLIRVSDMSRKDKTLTLEHVFDGRELQKNYMEETVKYIVDLWGHPVLLRTTLNGKNTTLVCDENKKIKYI
jgi:stage V sporulation protein R